MKDYVELNEKYIHVSKDLETAKSKVESKGQCIAELNLRLTLAEEKEKERFDMEHETKMKINELELSCEKAETTCESLHNEIDRLLQNKVSGGDNTGVQFKKTLEIVSARHGEEMERRDKIIHSLNKQNTELSIQAEKDKRKREQSLSSQQNLESNIRRERTSRETCMDKLQNELMDVKTQAKASHLAKEEALTEKYLLKRQIVSNQESLATTKSELVKSREDERRRTQESLQTRNQLQAKLDELNKKLHTETARLTEEKVNSIIEHEEVLNQKDREIDCNRRKINQVELSIKESLNSNQALREEIQSITRDCTNAKNDLESRLQNTITEYKKSQEMQKVQNNELSSRLHQVSEENIDMEVKLKTFVHELYMKERNLINAEDKVSSLSEQLHDNFSGQKEKISQVKHLKMEIRQLRLQAQECR